MRNFTRRQFLKGSLAASAALALPGRNVLGANEEVRLGIIGCGGQGNTLGNRFYDQAGTRIVALAEPDQERLDAIHANVPDADPYLDFRELLDRDDVDAVVIAGPVHWHALMAVWSMEAGKDVYVEKPFAHNIWESHQVVRAARKHNRIVQVGTQQRSDPVQDEIKAFLDSGEIGDVQWIKIVRMGGRDPIGKRDTPKEWPGHIDQDLWHGPAQIEPIYRDEVQYDWHWDFNTGSGEIGNWGPHVVDDAYNVGLRDFGRFPHRGLACAGGRLAWDDAGDTPNTFISYFETDLYPVMFELRNVRETGNYRGVSSGYVVQCEGGYYAGGRRGGSAFDNDGNEIKEFTGDAGAGHYQNFLEAVRSRNPHHLTAEVGTIFYSNTFCHMANLAYRLGQHHEGALTPDDLKGLVGAFEPWHESVDGFFAHLEDIGVDTAEADIRMMPEIEFDPESGYTTGAHDTWEARNYIKREYREPYVLDEQ